MREIEREKIVYKESSFLLEGSYTIRTIHFKYPSNLSWQCIRCGSCCKNSPLRDRQILLLPGDLERLQSASKEDYVFFVSVSEFEPFLAEMFKLDGVCVFFEDDCCSIYPQRPLLCRMYPFYVEKQGKLLIVGFDDACPGLGSGEKLKKSFYQDLLMHAVTEREKHYQLFI